MIQIGVKSEFRQNLGRLGLFYGNKTQVPLLNFQPVLHWTSEDSKNLTVQIKAVDSTLDAGAQIQQMITAECIDSYSGNARLHITKFNIIKYVYVYFFL
jgi:AP-2 complex subunit alpha